MTTGSIVLWDYDEAVVMEEHKFCSQWQEADQRKILSSQATPLKGPTTSQ